MGTTATETIAQLRHDLVSCELCPRRCRVNRLAGDLGYCGIGPDAVVSSFGPHFGEEPPLVGRHGSGTIFFTGCNLGCVFCQNYETSHFRNGRRISVETLAQTMLDLQARGCHNVNWVTPTHQVPAIADALVLARERGLRIPTVYNCGGYECVETLQRIAGLVDIYMPDAKFADSTSAERFASAPDYPERMRAALKEMHRQVGDLEVADGIARRGLLVRHLVMPNGAAESMRILDFIAQEISPNTAVNIMDQYRPTYRAHEFPQISHPLDTDEYLAVVHHAQALGLRLTS